MIKPELNNAQSSFYRDSFLLADKNLNNAIRILKELKQNLWRIFGVLF